VAALALWAGELTGRWPLLRNPEEPSQTGPAAVAFATLAVTLLAKIPFRVTLYGYGFVLAAPAMVALVMVLLGAAPGYLRRSGRLGNLYQAYVAGIIAAVLVLHLGLAGAFLDLRQYGVGEGADRMRGDATRAEPVDLAMDAVIALDSIETLVVVPEGAMVNYLLRTRSSVPFVTFLPLELILFGEEAHVQSLSGNPPDGILMTNREGWYYGAFGQDYGAGIARWIDENYSEVWSHETVSEPGPDMSRDTFRVRLFRPTGR
jgi:hypothetical protein